MLEKIVLKKIQKLSLILLHLVLLSSCSTPDFVDVNNKAVFLKDLGEKWLVLNYWATWCAPCIAEIPELNSLNKDHAEILSVVGVNFDQPGPELQLAQVKKMKIEFTVLASEPAEKLNIQIPLVLPTTYIFSPGGALVKTLVGPQTKESLMQVILANK